MTNYKRITKMSPDELAKFLDELATNCAASCEYCPAYETCSSDDHRWDCVRAFRVWLGQEAEHE